MDVLEPKIFPLGSLAVLFAMVSILIIIIKTSISREAQKRIASKMRTKRKEKNESLSEQKKRLELLLKK